LRDSVCLCTENKAQKQYSILAERRTFPVIAVKAG
jgi:hypothetical protein